MDYLNWKAAELAHIGELWDVRPKGLMQHTKECWNEKAHDWERGLRENEKRQERSRKRVEATAAYLIERGVLTENTDVMDIGCGPGRFVAEFAKTARSSEGLDISDQMTQYGLEYCKENGLENVSFYARDFKNMDLKAEGLYEKYDLVFSSITPAIGYRGGYEKAMEMSKAWFFNANFISIRDTLEEALEEKLGTHPVRYRDGAGFYCMLNELLLKGYYPELRYYREEDCDIFTPEEALEEYEKLFYRQGANGNEIRQMKEALESLKKEDGRVVSEKEWVYVWLLVEKNSRNVH